MFHNTILDILTFTNIYNLSKTFIYIHSLLFNQNLFFILYLTKGILKIYSILKNDDIFDKEE